LCNVVLSGLLFLGLPFGVYLGLRDYVFDESVSFHEVEHAQLLRRVVEFAPSFFKSLTRVNEFIGLGQ